jgi:hypothetical protein
MKSPDIIKKILVRAFLLSVFLPHKLQFLNEYFDFYWYYPFYFLALLIGIFESGVMLWIRSHYFKFMLVITGLSVISYFVNPYKPYELVKQVGGFAFVGFAWLVFFKILVKDKSLVLKNYYYIALIMAALTIPEQVLHMMDIHLTPKKGGWLGMYRCYSLSGEPFFLGMVITPAFIFGFDKSNGFKFLTLTQILLGIGIFFTFSGAVWLALLIYFSFKALKSKNEKVKWIAVAGMLTVFGSFMFYTNTRLRIEETVQAFNYFPNPVARKALATNESSRTVYLNAVAAYHNLKQNPVTGGGLGSHVNAYHESIIIPLKENDVLIGHLNKYDGGSGFIRLISETGIAGLILFLFIILKLFKTYPPAYKNAFLTFVLIRLLHAGNYFQYGTFFWFLLVMGDAKTDEVEKELN